jgi:hypothetical protein
MILNGMSVDPGRRMHTESTPRLSSFRAAETARDLTDDMGLPRLSATTAVTPISVGRESGFA